MRAARLGAFALVALALPLAVGAALGPHYGGELSIGLSGLPASLAPGTAEAREQRLVLLLTHETLVNVEPSPRVRPGLVAEWSEAAGGREWTLRLREGLSFHDRHPIDAAAVAGSLRRFLKSSSRAADWLARELEGGLEFRQGRTGDLAGLQPGEPTVTFRLTAPRAFPPRALAAPAAAVTSPQGAGCGPFVPSAPVTRQHLALAAFHGHVRGRPFLDRVLISTHAGPRALDAAFRSGRLDVVPGGPGPTALASTLLARLDVSRAPFNRPSMRAAVAGVLDPHDLAGLVGGGVASPCLLGPAVWSCVADARLQPEPMVAEPTRPAVAVVMAVDEDVPPLLSQRVVARLAEIGLRVDARSARAAGGRVPHLRLIMFTPEVPDPALALAELAALASHDGALQALDLAVAERDPQAAAGHLQRAESALRASGTLLSLGAVPVALRLAPRVHDVAVDGGGRLRLEDAWQEPR